MDPIARISEVVTERSKTVIAVMLVLTLIVGYGAPMVEQQSGLSQFESESEAANAQQFISENFRTDNNTTSVQIIVRNESGNVLSKASLVQSLRYQMQLRERKAIAKTLVDDRSTFGIANFVATYAIAQERLAELRARQANLTERRKQLEARKQQLEARSKQLNETRRQLQARSDRLNATARNLSKSLATIRVLQAEIGKLNQTYDNTSNATYQRKLGALRAKIDQVIANATEPLNATQTRRFRASATTVRSLQRNLSQLNASHAAGNISDAEYAARAKELGDQLESVIKGAPKKVLAEEFAELRQDTAELQKEAAELRQDSKELKAAAEQLKKDAAELKADFEAFRESPPDPTLQEQLEQLQSMNASEIDSVLKVLLSRDSEVPGSERALELLPKDFEPGSTTASARIIIVVQRVERTSAVDSPSTISDRIVKGQLAMQDVAQTGEYSGGSEDYIVFGGGVITDEIDQSLTDTGLIVGPLAVLFVLVTLLIAYRDPLDIALGLLGIFVVLIWTWGFMGWVGIPFNQIMIAVPVLLIGLSIDYAIHTFMRHRENRLDDDVPETDPRGSMRIALAGVGLALIWVTATTVIGFMSNVISPLPPIRDFGYASSAGITATLLVFGAFIPALKVEIDEFFEERLGWDRRKRAFGTGGGRFSQVLSLGAAAARKAPFLVILVALVITAAGAYGGSQVDTTFEQEDFLAQDPPDWMDRLPEPFAPGEYSAKQHLDYVYANFQSPDQQAQILVRGTGGNGIATAEALHSIEDAQERAANRSVVYKGPAGTDITSPLTVMHDVAANNASFNETFQSADTDDDGVPEKNVTAVLDKLFAVAPQQASSVIYRTEDGTYAAYRIRIALEGTATSSEVTTQFRDLADGISKTKGVTATATGSPIVNEIVQQQLLDTVIESLLVTLVAIFVFLMVVYRLTEGSATLGIVTLLPVALSVAWILGTMFLIDIPFNAVTGTITSLTVGLGVAYSIHLSERYNLELERRGDVRSALRTSVTGTGGALLGSAATTAGGFGVLAFAIFPALQQFGIITAITIVYAFLGSVFVLPSVLVVWTRYLGPDVPFEAGDTDADDSGGEVPTDDGGSDTPTVGESTSLASDTAGDDPDGSTAEDPLASAEDDTDPSVPHGGAEAPADLSLASGADFSDLDGEVESEGEQSAGEDEGGTTDAGTEDGSPDTTKTTDAESDTMDDHSGDADGAERSGDATDDAGLAGAVAADDLEDPADVPTVDPSTITGIGAGVAGAGGPDAERSVAPATPRPGESVTVSVVARDQSGTVVIRERVPGVGGRVASVDPEPLARAKDGRTVYLVWRLDDPTDIGLNYETTVPEDAVGGEKLPFEGRIERPDGEAEIGGDGSITVATAFLEHLDEADRITDEHLAEAARRARAGDLTGDAFEHVYRRWLDDSGEMPASVEDRVEDTFSGDLEGHHPDASPDDGDDAGGSR